MKNGKTTQYNHSKNVCFLFSACFVLCYYLIVPSMSFSILIFVIETQFNVNALYKILFMSHSNLMLE